MRVIRRGVVRKLLAVSIAVAQLGVLASVQIGSIQPALAATICGTAGKDGSKGTLSGVYNTYYAPLPGTTLIVGSTSFNIGNLDTVGGGAATAVGIGDELLIIQMQDGSFNSTNSSSYGDGASGAGLTSAGNAGLYEYVLVTNLVGSTVTIRSTGAGNGLLNTYHEVAASGSNGQQTFQIIRVPQFLTATLGGNFRAAYWDGSTGGVAALDLASTLNLGGATIYATGNGFRGAGKTTQTSSPTTWSSGDYAQSSTTQSPPADGAKGEGILGTPNYLFYYTNYSSPATPVGPTLTSGGSDGYPGGDQARGAPGNAGGGGTDDDPPANDQNTGGGGGANGGTGGNGGYPWTPTYTGNTSEYLQYPFGPFPYPAPVYAAGNFHDVGGRGGVALPSDDILHAFLGGGGGAGSNNNNSNNNSYNNYGSSGGTGGGVIMMRIAQTSGAAATIVADGTTGLAPANDGGGGGGAGGTVIITSPSSFSGITVHADGAAGTTANAAPNSLTQQHGPGGGGGGGIVVSTSPVTATVNGGAAGTTTTFTTTYGATTGAAGAIVAGASASQVPGIASGAQCSGSLGSSKLFIGPVDIADTGAAGSYGASEVGSFDGVVSVTNTNDYTARGIPPPSGTQLINTSTIPGSPIGNTFKFSAGTAPSIAIPNSIDYTHSGKHDITINAQAPAGWTVQLCSDNGIGTLGSGAGSNGPDCTINVTLGTSTTSCQGGAAGSSWDVIGQAAGNTTSATYCMDKDSLPPTNAKTNQPISNNPNSLPYDVVWAIYTPPTGTSITAFQRYDANLTGVDDLGSSTNGTHNELYAGYVPLTKKVTVISNGCPSGVTPVYSALGVCPGGILQYSVDYRNIVAGAGAAGSTEIAAAMLSTGAGTFGITDDGTLSGVSQTLTPNWSTFTLGLRSALAAGVANTLCGNGVNPCGDTTAGTTFVYDGGHPTGLNATKFTATVGGAAFQLYPQGFPATTGQGSITFAVTVK